MSLKEQIQHFVREARHSGISLEEIELAVRKQVVIDALLEFRCNQVRAARAIGMHRNTLTRQVHSLGIDVPAMRVAQSKKKAASVAPAVDVAVQTA